MTINDGNGRRWDGLTPVRGRFDLKKALTAFSGEEMASMSPLDIMNIAERCAEDAVAGECSYLDLPHTHTGYNHMLPPDLEPLNVQLTIGGGDDPRVWSFNIGDLIRETVTFEISDVMIEGEDHRLQKYLNITSALRALADEVEAVINDCVNME